MVAFRKVRYLRPLLYSLVCPIFPATDTIFLNTFPVVQTPKSTVSSSGHEVYPFTVFHIICKWKTVFLYGAWTRHHLEHHRGSNQFSGLSDIYRASCVNQRSELRVKASLSARKPEVSFPITKWTTEFLSELFLIAKRWLKWVNYLTSVAWPKGFWSRIIAKLNASDWTC